MTKQILLMATTAVFTITASAASATGSGYFELSYDAFSAYEHDNEDEDSSNSGTISGAYAFEIGSGQSIILEGIYHTDEYGTSIYEADTIAPQTQVGVHYMYTLNSGMKVGAFAGYGDAPHEDDDEHYQVAFGGVEAIYAVSPDLTLFGQVGLGTSLDADALESSGFLGGTFLRIGATYSGMDSTALTLDMEIAGSSEYEDDDEPGSFLSVGLSGITSLTADDTWSATYGARYAVFDALGDSNSISETSLNLGIRYAFGGTNALDAGIIGLPYTPLRASVWTPTMD
jgi:hypothetical protein